MANRIVLDEDDVPGAKLIKKPQDCSVLELKRWLECHGFKKSGKKIKDIMRHIEISYFLRFFIE